MILILPYPPSVNTYWRANGKRRFISKAGIEFKSAVQVYVTNHSIPKLGTARLSMDILICPRSRRIFDIDNLLKATLDALMAAGVYEDDSQIDDLHIVRGPPCKDGAAVVSIKVIDGVNGWLSKMTRELLKPYHHLKTMAEFVLYKRL